MLHEPLVPLILQQEWGRLRSPHWGRAALSVYRQQAVTKTLTAHKNVMKCWADKIALPENSSTPSCLEPKTAPNCQWKLLVWWLTSLYSQHRSRNRAPLFPVFIWKPLLVVQPSNITSLTTLMKKLAEVFAWPKSAAKTEAIRQFHFQLR